MTDRTKLIELFKHVPMNACFSPNEVAILFNLKSTSHLAEHFKNYNVERVPSFTPGHRPKTRYPKSTVIAFIKAEHRGLTKINIEQLRSELL